MLVRLAPPGVNTTYTDTDGNDVMLLAVKASNFKAIDTFLADPRVDVNTQNQEQTDNESMVREACATLKDEMATKSMGRDACAMLKDEPQTSVAVAEFQFEVPLTRQQVSV
mmetsp:Transcript_52722/g.112514  ORF Transcript_52722/g.112514 Transcript_52722/m.112514 type:complete len:111 (+) Transcript_52722:869-1201(+)